MAITMIRKPSETPNVRNIDDIIPFRYAYLNQNGYIKNKAHEIDYSIDGLNFNLRSGRLVLQGVESDIDANGITITVDNVPQTRYYTVYYRVNLALNITSIEYIYDTATYPTIDLGDDLIVNTSGSANLVLYKFKALSGVISNVEKVVQPIDLDEYIKSLEVYNAANSRLINNLNVRLDSNGLLRCGDFIVPMQKVLWQGSININNDRGDYIQIGSYSESLRNKRLVIEYKMVESMYGSTALNKTDVIMVDENITNKTIYDREFSNSQGSGYIAFTINTSGSNNYISGTAPFVVEGSDYLTPVYVTRVYEIIE